MTVAANGTGSLPTMSSGLGCDAVSVPVTRPTVSKLTPETQINLKKEDPSGCSFFRFSGDVAGRLIPEDSYQFLCNLADAED